MLIHVSIRHITNATKDVTPDILFFVIGLFAAVAIIIFGIKGDGQFLPDYEHNYLSWSFGLAFVGAVFSEVAGVLFLIEARIIRRKEIARDKQFPMEQRV